MEWVITIAVLVAGYYLLKQWSESEDSTGLIRQKPTGQQIRALGSGKKPNPWVIKRDRAEAIENAREVLQSPR